MTRNKLVPRLESENETKIHAAEAESFSKIWTFRVQKSAGSILVIGLWNSLIMFEFVTHKFKITDDKIKQLM
jgi:hypothetical protein